MSEWKSYCLGDLATFKYGKMPDKKKVSDLGKYPVYSGYRYVGYYDEYNIEAGQLIIVARGVGGTGDVKLTKEKCWLTNLSIVAKILDYEKVIPQYLYYLFKINNLRYLDSGSAQSQITIFDLERVKVNLPPLETQKKIAAVLSAFDDKIELNNAINKNLEEQAQAIYKNMFVDNFNPAWRKCRADEVFNISIGKTPPRKEHQWFTQDAKDITWVSISDMGSCGVYIGRSSEYLTAEAVKKFNVKKVPRNTVILSFKLTVGRVAITNRELTTNEAIAHFITNDSSMTEYVYLYLKNFSYQTMGSTSSIATAINSKIIKAMSFVLPTEEELCTFHKLVEPLFLMILQNQHENQKLGELRDALLPRLMSGEIDVSEVEI